MNLTPDVIALVAAVDAGEDCLLQLADALEEAGDPRAAGLRLVGDRRPHDSGMASHGWMWLAPPRRHHHAVLPQAMIDRMAANAAAAGLEGLAFRDRRGVFVFREPDGRITGLAWDCFAGRSAPILALAAALSG